MDLTGIFSKYLRYLVVRLLIVSLLLCALVPAGLVFAGQDLVAVGSDGFCVAKKDITALKGLLGGSIFLSPKAWEKQTVRVKLFALAAAKAGLISDKDTKGAGMKDLVRFASLYKGYVVKNWEPSDLAIVSYYRANWSEFPDHNTLDADLRAVLKNNLRRMAIKKIYFQTVKNLEAKFKVHWCGVDDPLCRDVDVPPGL